MADARSAPVFGRRREPPALETSAIYARLAAEQGEDDETHRAFDSWRRERAPGRRLAWAVSLGLMAFGAVSFVVSAPPLLSGALELAGLFGGAWLRRERKRHLAAIRDWNADAT